MAITIEFFGIPRERAGVAATVAEGAQLGDVLRSLVSRFPRLAANCLDGGCLRPGIVANLNGEGYIFAPVVERPKTPKGIDALPREFLEVVIAGLQA